MKNLYIEIYIDNEEDIYSGEQIYNEEQIDYEEKVCENDDDKEIDVISGNNEDTNEIKS